ncbi:TonB-dependent receptor [Sphingomonas jaspsi]|uniref:TonB-dependent receptor n=1 Tax=Sphingomonas jaspsi TaxID=392409 RepID=UPI0004B20F42|nr:TonB-dependent receptor [Sphingomonas jaspsi]
MLPTAAEPPVIVVTGQRPSADERDAVVIARRTLDDAASGRIEDALATVPGLQSFRRSDSRSSNPSAQGLTLRGLGGNASSRTLVLLDGIPIADPFFGFVPLSALDPDRIGRISIVKGAGGGRFGSAVAGTIDIDSLALADRPDWRAGGAVSTGHAMQLGGGATGRLGDSVATLDARWDKGRGFWTTPADQRVAASARAAFNARSVESRFVAPLDGSELQFRAAAFRDERTLRFKGADSLSEGIDASLRYVSAARDLTLAVYGQRRNFANVVVSATRFVPVLDQYRTPATGAGAMAEWRPFKWLAVGADGRWTDGTAYERALSASTGAVTAIRANGGRIAELGAFAEANGEMAGLDLGGSMRLTRWSVSDGRSIVRDGGGLLLSTTPFDRRSGRALTGRVSIGQSGKALDWHAAASSGIRVPTLNELYRSFTVFPVTTLANPALKPERVVGAEAGVRWHPLPGVRADIGLFANRLHDAIANVTLSPSLRQRQNVDALTTKGIEAGLSVERGPWGFDGALSWLRARIGPLRPAQVPAFTASATLRWKDERSGIAVTLRHQGAAFDDDLNLDRLPAATTVDAVASRQLGRITTVRLRLENAFDRRTVTRNQAGSIDLGAPRALWLNVEFRAP